jgi:hypothetical protein
VVRFHPSAPCRAVAERLRTGLQPRSTQVRILSARQTRSFLDLSESQRTSVIAVTSASPIAQLGMNHRRHWLLARADGRARKNRRREEGMRKTIRHCAAVAVLVALTSVAMAQSSGSSSSGQTNSSAQQNEKDYRSLQYGNGRITPEQNRGIQQRANALNQAMSDEGTTASPSPSPSPTATPRPNRVRPE